MSYVTQQDLIDRFGSEELIELTDRADPPAGVIDATVLATALADADAVIDAYVGRRYELPLASTPAVLVKIAGDLARYSLYDETPSDRVSDARTQAMSFLKDLSAGRADLDIAGTEPAPAGDTVLVDGPDRVFNSDTMGGF